MFVKSVRTSILEVSTSRDRHDQCLLVAVMVVIIVTVSHVDLDARLIQMSIFPIVC
jgi:hypothetical protein